MRAARVAGLIRQTPGPRDEGSDFLLVITDLQTVVIHDDRPFQNGGVCLDEGDELRHLHGIEVDVLLHHDLGTGGDDILRAVLAFDDELLDVLGRERGRENRLIHIGDVVVVEPFLHFSATGATGGGVDLDHAVLF